MLLAVKSEHGHPVEVIELKGEWRPSDDYEIISVGELNRRLDLKPELEKRDPPAVPQTTCHTSFKEVVVKEIRVIHHISLFGWLQACFRALFGRA